MARTRSPNYPFISLPAALEGVRKIYDKEHRNRMGREVVAKHLGFGSLNGIAVSVVSALSKYGLLENLDNDLQVSLDAVTILVDSPDSPDRQTATRRAAFKPDLFTEIHKHFGGQLPSEHNLVAHLQKNGFTANAATHAAKSFRETMALVSQQEGGHNGERMQTPPPASAPHKPPPFGAAKPEQRPEIGERELVNIKLSAEGHARILISGQTTVKEIDKLIRVLKLQRELLADEPDLDVSSPESESSSDAADETKAGDFTAKFSFFITNSQKAQLRERGFTDEAIAKMKPGEAHEILGLQ
jgi:hypothetical protein